MNERQFAEQVVQKLRTEGYQALWAGGCVRDLLIGIEANDYDVATSAQPKQIRQLFGHGHTLSVGAAFGVIIVLSPDRQIQVEVATFRTDAHYSDGRHPDSVTFSTPEMDAQRRDFTINGLFYDPIEKIVIDYVGGQRDLQDRLLRAIGNPEARISEDKLRMLRAIRFAARFDLDIEASTFAAIVRHAAEVAVVSGERLAIELRKSLETSKASWAVQKWAETGLLNVLLPEVAARWSDVRIAILERLQRANKQGWQSRLAALLFDVLQDEETVELIERNKHRLKLSNEDTEAIAFALRSQSILEQASLRPWSQVQPLLISPWISVSVELLELRSGPGDSVAANSLTWLRTRLAWPTDQLNPPPLVTGQDLIARGLKPSPKFKQLLQDVRDQQLDGLLKSTSEAIRWIEAHR